MTRASVIPSLLCSSALAAILVVAAGVSATASGPGPAGPPSRGGAIGTTSSTTITGVAWNAANAPLTGAHLQLRNVANGNVVARANADEAGRFAFTNLEGGSYVIEVVNDAGKIIGLGHTFAIAPGETIATFVRLGTKTPWFADFFGNAAGAVTSTAASQGITALAPVQLPESSSPGGGGS